MTERSQPNSEVKMDSELKAKWINALRSGAYKQGAEKLHDSDEGSYCCLGVLCKVMGAEFGPASTYDNEYDFVPHLDGKILSSGDNEDLAEHFCKEIGIPNQSILIQMNDGTASMPASSFEEIADYIEKNL